MSEVALINLESIDNETGSIVALESPASIPFDVKRVYYLHSIAIGAKRGFHAHLELEQVAICVSGSCMIDVEYIAGKKKIEMASPKKALYMGGLVWREISNFSPDCVLLVLASEIYLESDYIRDYKTFLSTLDNYTAE